MSTTPDPVRLLLDFDQAISWPDLARSTDGALSFFTNRFDFDRVSFTLFNKDKSQLDVFTLDTSIPGLSHSETVAINDPDTRQVLTAKTPRHNTDLSRKPDASVFSKKLYAAGFLSYFSVPLMVGSDAVGSLNVGSRKKDAFPAVTQNLLILLSSRLALALFHARQHDNLVAREQALALSEKNYRELVDQAGDVILQFNSTGNIIDSNHSATRLFGFSREEFRSMQISDLFDTEVLTNKPLRFDLLDEGLPVITERDLSCKNGTCLPVEMNTKKLPDGSIVSIIRDLTERNKVYDQVLDQKNQMYALFDAVPSLVYAKDRQGRYTMLNDAYLKFFGKTRASMLGKTVTECWSTEKSIRFAEEDRKFLENEDIALATVELQNAQGEVRSLFERKARFLDAHGKVAGFVGTLMDITDLQAAEERYQALFTSSPDPIVVHDGQVILDGNQAAIDFFKTENPDKYRGTEISTFIHPDSLHDSRQRVKAMLSSRQPTTLMQQKFIISTGETRDVEVMAVPIEFEGKTAIMTSFRDVSNEIIIQRDLSNSEERYRRAFNYSPTSMVLHDRGVLIEANQAAMDFFGITSLNEIEGRNLFDFVHGDFLSQSQTGVQQILETEQAGPLREQKYLTLSGEDRWVEARDYPIHQGGKTLILVSFNDIHDRVIARQQVEKSRQQLEMITGHLTNFLLLVDLNLNLQYVNNATAQWLMKDGPDLIGRPLNSFVSEADLSAGTEYLPRLLKGEVCSYHHHLSYAGRGERDFLITLIPVMEEAGEVLAFLIQMDDVTEFKTTQKELAENKELLELIIDTIPGLFSYTDANERFLFVNQSYADWHGKDKTEILGKPLGKFLPEKNYAEIKPYLKKIYRGEEQSFSRWSKGPDGQKHAFDVRYIPHVDQNNNTKAFLTSLQDVTERRNAESRQQALQELAYTLTKSMGLRQVGVESAKTLRRVFESDALTIELYDNPQNLILGIYSEDTFKGDSKPKSVPTHDIPFSDTSRYDSRFKAQCINRSEEDLKQKLDTVSYGDNRPCRSLLFVPLRREGVAVGVVSVQSYSLNKYSESDLPLLQSFADQIGGALVRAQNNAQLQEQQDALAREEEKYRSIIENAGDAIFVATNKGQILTVNDHACSTLGYSTTELTQMNLRDIDTRFFKQLSKKALASLKNSGDSLTLISEHLRKDNSGFPVELRVSVTQIDKTASILCFARDITDRQQAEQKEQSLRKLAHDLNNSSTLHNVGKMAATSIRSFFNSDAFTIEYFDTPRSMIVGIYTEDTFRPGEKPRELKPQDTPFSHVRPDFFTLNSVAHVRNRTPEQLESLKGNRPFGSERLSHSLLFAPIIWENTNIGVLAVQSYTDNMYSEADLPNIQTFADQIGSALIRTIKDEELTTKKNELQESEEKYRSMIENAGDALFVTSFKGQILAFNKHATSSLGYDEAELLDLKYKSINPDFSKQLPRTQLSDLKKTGASITLDTTHLRKDGSSIPVELRVGTMDLHGKPCLLCFARDVSERKDAEEFRDAMRRLARQLTVSLEPRQVGIIASSVLYDLFDYDAFGLYKLDLEKNIAVSLFSQDTFEKNGLPIEAEADITELDILNHRSVFVLSEARLINRTKKDDTIRLQSFGNTRRRSKSLAFVPIFWEGNQIGLFSIQSYTRNKYTEEDLPKLKIFANQIGGAIVRAQTDEVLLLQSRELQEAVSEKEVLLKEVYHRTKNNMQVIVGLLEMQGLKTKSNQTKDVLHEMTNRIYSMSMVHDLLYRSKNLAEIMLDDYMEKLLARLLTAYSTSEAEITTDVNVESIPINIQSAIPLGLVINEVVSNALKYAFPDNRDGKIFLTVTLQGETGLELIIGDNGVGLDKSFDLSKATTLGTRIIKDIVQLQLQGELNISNAMGVEYHIKIPSLDLD